MHIHTYLERLDCEIDRYIHKESRCITANGEQMLHVMLENRKHAMQLMEEKHGAKMDPRHSHMEPHTEKHNPY